MTSENKFNLLIPTLISLVIILFASNLIINNYFISSLDNKLIDYHFNRRGTIFSDQSSKVIILGISNETLKELPPPYNQWPLARNLFAKVISNLNQVGVKVIGIDILFNEEDRYNKLNDTLFLNEIQKFNNVVLAAKLDELDDRFISTSNQKNYSNYFYKGNDDLIGIVNVIPDFDGVIRRYYSNYYDLNSNKNLPTFSYNVFNNFIKQISPKNDLSKEDFPKIHLGSQPVLINYYGPPNTFTTIELIDILDDQYLITNTEKETGVDINTWDDSISGLKYSEIFEDKIVLIGSVEPEDKDIYPVAISSDTKMQHGNLMYGVEIHANVVQMLLDNSIIKRVSPVIIIFIIILSAYLLNFLFDIQKKFKGSSLAKSEILNLLLLFIFIYTVYEISYRLFINHYAINISSIVLTGVSIYISSLISHYLSERKQKLMIKNMFSHYVSSKIVEDLIENPQKLKLGGERKELTILFSDITNFTSLSESIEPEILVEFMNDYFDTMTEIIFHHNGTLDKFEGDAIMAFWNAPISDPKHTFNAIQTALDMRALTKTLNDKWFDKLNFNITTRIGINTGEAIVGNMGSNKKFDFTVMGDNVNIAARLEAINKFYGTDIIVSEKTMIENNSEFIFRELDNLLVKGKSKPIKIFELISSVKESEGLLLQTIVSQFQKAIILYRQREFFSALEIFNNILSLKPNDKPSLVYVKRCQEYISKPPDESWQGISEVDIK